MTPWDGDKNPLLSDSSQVWSELIEAVEPASLLVVIAARMSPALKRRYTEDDVLQDVLLYAWRDRRQCEWRGIKSFRLWMLSLIDHRLRNLADYEGAAKRSEKAGPLLSEIGGGELDKTDPPSFGPVASTTPSRIAIYKEQAVMMRSALESLPLELREVIRLRIFEQLSLEEIAGRLQLGVSAVRHRFRKGSLAYEEALKTALASRSSASGQAGAPLARTDSSLH